MPFYPCPRLQRWAILLPVAMSVALVGCGSSTGTVTGKVTFKDKVVKGGIVMFVAEGKPSAQSQIGEDGSYSVKDAPAGSVKICVDTSSMDPSKASTAPKYAPPKDAQAPEGFGSGGPDRDEMKRRYVEIPEKYADPKTTTLTTTVTGGTQTYDIKIEP